MGEIEITEPDRSPGGHRRWTQWATTAALVAAALSAAVFALLDAATIPSRTSGETVGSRPMWLHSFSIAILTFTVVASVSWIDATKHASATRAVYVVTGVANLSVPALALARPRDGLHVLVPTVHVALCALLVAMAILMTPGGQADPTWRRHRTGTPP